MAKVQAAVCPVAFVPYAPVLARRPGLPLRFSLSHVFLDVGDRLSVTSARVCVCDGEQG